MLSASSSSASSSSSSSSAAAEEDGDDAVDEGEEETSVKVVVSKSPSSTSSSSSSFASPSSSSSPSSSEVDGIPQLRGVIMGITEEVCCFCKIASLRSSVVLMPSGLVLDDCRMERSGADWECGTLGGLPLLCGGIVVSWSCLRRRKAQARSCHSGRNFLLKRLTGTIAFLKHVATVVKTFITLTTDMSTPHVRDTKAMRSSIEARSIWYVCFLAVEGIQVCIQIRSDMPGRLLDHHGSSLRIAREPQYFCAARIPYARVCRLRKGLGLTL